MVQHIVLRILLSPIALIYGIVIGARNTLYQIGLLRSSKFNLPVIGVGNLSMGGSGKTPHVEYLIRLLQPYINLGILSRGYLRKTTGYMEVMSGHGVDLTGDESLQYKLKYPDVIVSVSERRAIGIPQMIGDHPDLQTIILDDAFQHLSVTPGLNLLVTDYKQPFFDDFLLPAGRLREWRRAYKRAQVIVVSKCPPDMTSEEMDKWVEKIKPTNEQKVFFSTYEYGKPYYMYDHRQKIELDADTDVIMLTGIAKPIYVQEYLEDRVNFVNVHAYEDHHNFKPHEVSLVHRALPELQSKKKVVITTEKDSTRLDKHRTFLQEKKIPIFILPIKVRFLEHNKNNFDEYVKDFLLNFRV